MARPAAPPAASGRRAGLINGVVGERACWSIMRASRCSIAASAGEVILSTDIVERGPSRVAVVAAARRYMNGRV